MCSGCSPLAHYYKGLIYYGPQDMNPMTPQVRWKSISIEISELVAYLLSG